MHGPRWFQDHPQVQRSTYKDFRGPPNGLGMWWKREDHHGCENDVQQKLLINKKYLISNEDEHREDHHDSAVLGSNGEETLPSFPT